MTLLRFDLDRRRAAVAPGGPLAALADSLAADLMPLMERFRTGGALPIPDRKARLTRIGGRCPEHGTLLTFDPWSPHRHRCERCGREYEGQEHDDAWATHAHLWTVERAVHAAALWLLRGDPDHAVLAMGILRELVARYPRYPNSDNVLGPSRPFFSTYLESIWLLNACHALALLEHDEAADDAPADLARLGREVRRGLLAPSSALIAGFPEGLSNRQAWNEVAILSSIKLLGDDAAFERRLDAEDGLLDIFERGLLEDGTWYEGENYHLFAHRAHWYGVELLRAHADDDVSPLEDTLDARYTRGFVAPFLGMLPDDTLPSRRDSQYAVSIRQWRIAEHLELGHAHGADPQVAGLLARLYDGSGDGTAARDERARSTADAERNAIAGRLDRASLSWRALLMAREEAPPPALWSPRSAVLPVQGIATLRRDGGRTYVALEGGHTGGLHGHPDRLALTFQQDGHRWLQDPGTGSYVERALHWYRSTLAHHAPLVDRRSQRPRPATLLAHEDRGGAGWISKRVVDAAPGVTMERTVVVCDGYLVDVLRWEATDGVGHEITLPIAAETRGVSIAGAAEDPTRWPTVDLPGAGGLEDGFEFLVGARGRALPAGAGFEFESPGATAFGATEEPRRFARAQYAASHDATIAVAAAPGVPGGARSARCLLQTRAPSGTVVGVWFWPAVERDGATTDTASSRATALAPADPERLATVRTSDGTSATHGFAPHGWHVALAAGGATSSIDLEWLPPAVVMAEAVENDTAEPTDEAEVPIDFEVPYVDMVDAPVGDIIDGALLLPLGEHHYDRTELAWRDAGEPTATLQLACTDTELVADLDVETGPVVAPAAGEENPLDNERAAVNADGVQWYVRHPDRTEWAAAGLVVPAPGAGGEAHQAYVLAGHPAVAPRVEWESGPRGWRMRLSWALDLLPVADDGCLSFDLIVNERPPERERRRGQLVLSGGGHFTFLRGDRHRPEAALLLALPQPGM